MTAIVAMLVALAAGWLVRWLEAFPEDGAEALNRFVLWICLPALVLARVPGLSLRMELLALAIAPWIISAIVAGAVLVIGRVLAWPRAVVGCLLLLAVLGNTSFLGFPLVTALLGAEHVQLAAVYDQFGTFLLVSSYGLLVLATYGGQARPSARAIALRVVAFPPFIALLVALVLPGPLPDAARAVCEALAAPLLPLVAFALGLKLRLRLPPGRWTPLMAGLGLKLVVMPLACWALLAALPVSDIVRQVAVLEAAMPPMFTAAALAISSDIEPELSAALVGYGLIVGLVTVFAWSMLIA
jgi:predicted permease